MDYGKATYFMSDVITTGQLAILASLHLLYVLLIATIGWFLLAKPYRYVLIGSAAGGWLWSLAAMVNFNQGDTGFFSWFLDPASEKNITAIATSILLALIGTTALILLWKTGKNGNERAGYILPLRLYWLLLALMFLFLAVDEYTSIHEQFHRWRQGYLGLGGSIALLSLFIAFRDKFLRRYIIMFIIGLGSLGFAGVILDAFSNQNIIDIGSFNLTLFTCPRMFLGVDCRDYANTEELWEFVGASTMWLSLLSVASHWQQPRITHRILAITVGVWAFVLIGWLWIFPFFENQMARPVRIIYDDLTVIGYSISQDRVQAGDTLDVTIYAHANRLLHEDYSMSVHLYTQPEIESIAQGDMELGEFDYPTRAWLPMLPVRNRFTLHIPDDLPTGVSYQLVAMLWQGEAMQSFPVNESSHPTLLNNQIIVLAGIPALSATVADAPDNGGYQFAEGFTLDGYEIPQTLTVGDTVTARFWWSAANDIDTQLTQYIHAFNVETDELFVFDQQPFGGRFPTNDWIAGMRELDEWTFQLPTEMPPATYRIHMGLYNPFTGERMPVMDSSGQPVQDNSIVLGEWVVQE
jgi:hypothetical protein